MSSTGYKNIFPRSGDDGFQVQIRRVHVGSFKYLEDAIRERDFYLSTGIIRKRTEDYKSELKICRFFKHVKKTKDCWIWIGAMTEYGGYGLFSENNKNIKAHRFSYREFVGEIPEGKIVMHECDNPPCVNPDHLRVGSQSDNINDMIAKRRHVFGERKFLAKLTDEKVKEIRAIKSYWGINVELGRMYGVSDNIIGLIRKNKLWRHV